MILRNVLRDVFGWVLRSETYYTEGEGGGSLFMIAIMVIYQIIAIMIAINQINPSPPPSLQ